MLCEMLDESGSGMRCRISPDSEVQGLALLITTCLAVAPLGAFAESGVESPGSGLPGSVARPVPVSISYDQDRSDDGGETGRKDDGGDWVVPAVLVGVAALAALHSLNSGASETQPEPSSSNELTPREREVLADVLRNGPRFPTQYNTSAFAVVGSGRAGWPVVLDFERSGPGYVWLRVRGRATQIYTYALHPLGIGRKVVQVQLPDELGDTLRPVMMTVMATEDPQARTPLPEFRLYGLGCGPRAVGSVAINQLRFGPADINVDLAERARYRFRTSSAFQRLAVEFLRIPGAPDGEHQILVDSLQLPAGSDEGQVIGRDPPRTWNGRDDADQVSLGDHRLRVRGWHPDGAWVGALSDSTVRVLD